MANPKDSDKEQPDYSSQNDEGSQDVPSVTKLLNRKSLSGLSSPSSPPPQKPLPQKAPPPPPPAPVEPPPPAAETPNKAQPSTAPSPPEAVSLSDSNEAFVIESSSGGARASIATPSPQASQPIAPSAPLSPPTDPAPPLPETTMSVSSTAITRGTGETTASYLGRVQPGIRRNRSSQSLILWDLNQLKTGTDPIGKGISLAVEKGAIGALFLGIVAPSPGSNVPNFVATAAVLAPQKLSIWTGLKWNPTVVPEMWNHFVKNGTVELSPPGSFTSASSNRNVVRAAFGILQTEWLLLIRAGPPTACRGVVGLVTSKSFVPDLKEIVDLITLPAPSQKK